MASLAQQTNEKSPGGKSLIKINVVILLHVPITTTLKSLELKMRISTLKTKIEQEIGILPEMYMLTYLDMDPLDDDTTLRDHYIVNDATLTLRPWKMWQELLENAYLGKSESCLRIRTMDIKGDSHWNRHCAWCALYIASHRGFEKMVARLLRSTSVLINSKSPCGWTSLHAAARMGRWKALCVLLDNGADVRCKDNEECTAWVIAKRFGHKKCEHSLNFCHWNFQKHVSIQDRKSDYDASSERRMAERRSHLFTDSTLSTWQRGTHGQLYLCHIPNPVTVQDVKEFQKYKKQSLSTLHPQDSQLQTVSDGAPFRFKYGWFDPLRAQELIPSTEDILSYANPSSCSLRPRSLLNPQGYVEAAKHKPSKKL